MSIAIIQPGQAVLTDPNGGLGGWTRGVPTPWDQGNGISAIGGIRSNATNIFADSPPIDGEVYLITGFRIGYAVLLPTDGPDPGDQPPITTELALLVGPDVVSLNLDTEACADINGSGVNATFLANGTISDDLINPIAVSSADRLSIRVGTVSAGEGATIMIGAQLDAQGAGAWAAIPFPSSLDYTLIKAQAS